MRSTSHAASIVSPEIAPIVPEPRSVLHQVSAMIEQTRILCLTPIVMFAFLANASCSSTTETVDGTNDDALLENAPFLGAWTSELDGSTLTIESTGIFGLDIPAKGDQAASGVVGRWAFDGAVVTFVNLHDTTACADVPGAYKAEIVRETARFELIKDECVGRQPRMAWPWKRPSDG